MAGVPQAPAGVGYTGHVYDEQVGLIYAGARWYDPEIGRFPSPDDIRFSSEKFVHFNRYIYGYNSPYVYLDPDGRESIIFGLTPQSVEGHRVEGEARRRSAEAEKSRNQEIIRRSSINAKGVAAAGTGIQAKKNLRGNGKDSIGWVPVGQGLYAGISWEFKLVELNLYEGAKDLPLSIEASGDIGVGVSVGYSVDFDPGGKLDIAISLGDGLGEHTSIAPQINFETE